MIWGGGGSFRLTLGKTRTGPAESQPTDISQGREMTPEGELKNEASVHAYSTIPESNLLPLNYDKRAR
jgi:hypothetical protein